MRILHVISSLDPKGGGVRQALVTMIKGLDELGIDNNVASIDSPDSHFSVEHARSVFQAGTGTSPWKYSSNLLNWLKKNLRLFDAVIVHGIWHYHSYAVYTVWKKITNKPKLYVMPHGMLDPYFQKSKDRKLKSLRNDVFWMLIEKKIINKSDGILFTCDQERLLANQAFRSYKPKGEFVVGLGVETPPPFLELMRQAFLKICPQLIDKDYLLFLGRIDIKKGLDLLIEAYEKLTVAAQKVANTNSTIGQVTIQLPVLVIAGPNVESVYGQLLKKRISKMEGLLQNVHFVGMLTGLEKWGAFYDCQAFVLPSHQENFGISVVEALACSKPVLISNQVNIWKEIEKANAGLVEADTIDGTETLLGKWLNLPEHKRSEMQMSARGLYDSTFNTRKACERLIAVLS